MFADINKIRKTWNDQNSTTKGVLFSVTTDYYGSIIFRAMFGSGMNLSEEDIENGNDASIYVDYWVIDEHGSYKEEHGGELVFDSKDNDYYTNLDSFIKGSMDICGFLLNENFTIDEMNDTRTIQIIQFINTD